MPIQRREDQNFSLDGIKTFVAADGLDDFAKALERDFFADVEMQCRYHPDKEKTDLILNLYFNFGLTESLHHFNSGNWGGFAYGSDNTNKMPSFDAAFHKLSESNNNTIDIAEVSLHFKDTSIIVTRIYDYSIPEQLGEIIFKISEHFVYFTKGLTEMPFEVFVPVFEHHPQKVCEPKQHQKSYFNFWGLYFENDIHHDVMVYALETKKLQKEDFFLLD